MQEVKDHFSRSQHAAELGKRVVFTFEDDLGKRGLAKVVPTG
jgi:hypothetical protein